MNYYQRDDSPRRFTTQEYDSLYTVRKPRTPFFPHIYRIWLTPRQTIQTILETNTNWLVFVFAILFGYLNVLRTVKNQNYAGQIAIPSIILIVFFLGPLSGFISVYLIPYLHFGLGKLFGGKADIHDVRAVMAWSQYPYLLISIVILAFNLSVFGWSFWDEYYSAPSWEIAALVGMLMFSFLQIVLWIWTFVIQVIIFAEVQGFSIGRSIASLVLANVVIYLPIACVLVPTIMFRLLDQLPYISPVFDQARQWVWLILPM